MSFEGNIVETGEVGPVLVLDHVVADLVAIAHLEGNNCLLCSANPIPVSKHHIEFSHKDIPVGHDPQGRLLDKEVAEPVRSGALEEGGSV